MKYALLAVCLSFIPTIAAAQKPVLTVLTYDSFVSDWGPGPAVKEAFEAECGCELRFVAGGDGAALLAQVQLEGENTHSDVVLGLDTALIGAARRSGLFAPHGLTLQTDVPAPFEDTLFLPYDWGWFAFVYEKALGTPPANFRALADSDLKIVIEDPRSSTPGLGLLLWIKAVYGDEAPRIWEGLADNIVTVTPGWSEAYGLFLEGEADMVLSYTTSPAYHLIAEGDDSKSAALFDEGHYMQIEIAGVLASSDQPQLARDFLTFMLRDAFQSVIATTNWMYPAVTPQAGLPEGFDAFRPKKSLLMTPDQVDALRGQALDEWRAALSR